MTQRISTGVSYFGNRNPRHFVSDLEELLRHSCTFVLHTFSENDQEYYKDTMQELVSLSKAAGLECYLDPWGAGRVFGGEAYSSFALKNRDACQVLPDGDPAPACCLNHPKFRAFMSKWIEDSADIAPDILFWDEPHFFINLKEKDRFPVWYCACPTCSRLFGERTGKSFADATREEIIAFREDCVVEFLTELCDHTHSKGMKNAVCLLPLKDDGIGMSDWSKVASIESVDIFGTDPYWVFFDQPLEKYVGDFAREISSLCQKFGKEPQLWIQAYKIPADREDELKEAIAIAYAEGIRNFAAWSYYGTEYMSYICSDNPKKVWDVLGDVYGEIQRGEWD